MSANSPVTTDLRASAEAGRWSTPEMLATEAAVLAADHGAAAPHLRAGVEVVGGGHDVSAGRLSGGLTGGFVTGLTWMIETCEA